MAHNMDETGLEHKIENFLAHSDQFLSFGSDSDAIFDRVYAAINAIYQKALYLAEQQEKQYQNYVESRAQQSV
ncbi:hypothetical protein CGI99_24650 [Vibrio parahaemolyticus]|nr:hypothetical protein CGI99_24650 [Vibrio parahaemolyticus]